jgi:prepilin-type N-terminal cleavage/methylation domain-containing protein
MKLNKFKPQKGFTIIEVMIVLAIAGLILVIVFLAVPQLQRSQRNTTRKSIADRIKTEIDNYASNNNGGYPAATNGNTAAEFGSGTQALSFAGKYFQGLGSSIQDPQTGNSVLLAANISFSDNTASQAPGATPGNLHYGTREACQGETTVATNNLRTYALLMTLEGGAVYCLDNH